MCSVASRSLNRSRRPQPQICSTARRKMRGYVMITQRSVDERRNACEPGAVGRRHRIGYEQKSRNPGGLRQRCSCEIWYLVDPTIPYPNRVKHNRHPGAGKCWLPFQRRAAEEMHMSFVELDRRAGTGRFFQKSCRRRSFRPSGPIGLPSSASTRPSRPTAYTMSCAALIPSAHPASAGRCG